MSKQAAQYPAIEISKENLLSLLRQSAIVFLIFAVAAILEVVNPSGNFIVLSFVLSGIYIVWVEHSKSRATEDTRVLVRIRLDGLGSKFLEDLHAAVDSQGLYIDYPALMINENYTFRTGFRILLEAFRNPPLSWINVQKDSENNSYQWLFQNTDSYLEFLNWLSREIIWQVKQEEEERQNSQSTRGSEKLTVVSFRTPATARLS